MVRAFASGRKVRSTPADRNSAEAKAPDEAPAERGRDGPAPGGAAGPEGASAASGPPGAPPGVSQEIQVTIVLPPPGSLSGEGVPGAAAAPPRPDEVAPGSLSRGFDEESRTSSAPEFRAVSIPSAPAPAPAAADLSGVEAALAEVRRDLVEFRGRLEARRDSGLEEAISALGRQVKAISDHVIEVRHMATARARKGETGEVAFNKLYEEMTRYRDNFLLAAEKPLFMALILLYDTVCRIERKLEGEAAPAASDVRSIKEELLEALYRHDIERIEERPERMDAAFQKAIRREETQDSEEDMRVAEVVRDGFRWGGKVIRPQEVVVRRYFAP